MLNALSAFISPKERIVTIEDAAELQLKQPHVARLETRPPNLEGSGAVRQRELLVNSLRMRPDRIVVGEVRGEEALDMLQAMNTGHDGSLTTIHANNPREAVNRLEVMVGMASSNMGVRAIRQQISSAVDLFVQVARFSDGSRRLTYVTELTGMEGEIITMQDIFVFDKLGITESGKIMGRFRATGIRLAELAAIRYHPYDTQRSDIDLWQREITVQGKASKPRIVRFGYPAARTLDRYLRIRARHAQAWRPQLWLGVNDRGPLTPSGIYQMITRRGRQAGVVVYPHRFRHHFSHTWLDRGGPEGDLMELNGWSSPQMLRRYGASARSARARRTYDRIMADQS